MKQARAKAYRSGLFAETLTALLLRLKGQRIVAQRYRTPVGEIDLVAPKGKRLAFIEVKRRKTKEEAAWTLPPRQRRRIVRAAQYWLAGHPTMRGMTLPSTLCSRRPSHGLATSPTPSRCDPPSFSFGETLPIRAPWPSRSPSRWTPSSA